MRVAVCLVRELFERAEGAGGDTNTLAVHLHGNQVHLLAMLGRDVGVAPGVRVVGRFAGEDVNAGHSKCW